MRGEEAACPCREVLPAGCIRKLVADIAAEQGSDCPGGPHSCGAVGPADLSLWQSECAACGTWVLWTVRSGYLHDVGPF